MIAPEEIRDKAVKLFEPAVQAWLVGDGSFFPKRLPRVDLTVSRTTTQPELIQQVERLRAGSKSQLGYGYTIVYEEVRKRLHGLNNYPAAIEFETPADLFRLIGKVGEVRRLEKCVATLREQLPQLETWLRGNWKRLLLVESELDDLVVVTKYMQQHPRPGCYPRELPLAVSTKLVMNHQSLLSDWWDRLLPEEAIDFGALKNFERRYGFLYPRQHLLLRVLDVEFGRALGLPCEEMSLPAEELHRLLVRYEASYSIGSTICRVVIIENKVNLLTMPPLNRAIAVGGRGNNMTDFLHVKAFERCEVEYWGDIDVDGLLMLARARRMFPHIRSCLMDLATLETFRHLVTIAPSASTEEPPELNEAELNALRRCRELGWRLEQEHVPQMNVVNAFVNRTRL